jgi:hypothetical protein
MRRRMSEAAAAVVIAAGLFAASPAGQAIATTPPTQPYTVAPAPEANGQQRGYFILSSSPGRSTTDVVVLGNNKPVTQRLRVGLVDGTTATDSGSAYSELAPRCAGVGCWVTGIPQAITLPPHSQDWLRFRVTVPAGVRPAQYLAGIAVTPDVPPQPVQFRSSGHVATRVLVVSRVVIGVAVTVGQLGTLRTKTELTGVTAGWVDGQVRLTVRVRNAGQRFTKATGKIACSLGSATHSFRFSMDTVLPGQGAGLPVNGGAGMHSGAWRCVARVMDSSGRVAVWTGTVTVPSTVTAATKEIAPNDFVAQQGGGIPGWAVALIVLCGLILVSLWAVLVRRRRYRGFY